MSSGRYLERGHPFVFKKANAPAAVVCIHGFTATPLAVRPVGEALSAAGFHVVGPAVHGHAIAPIEQGIEVLRHATKEQFMESVRPAIIGLHREFPKVFLFGQSMGGLLAFRFAAEGLASAIATCSAALHFTEQFEQAGEFLRDIDELVPKRPDKNRSFFHLTYQHNPTKAGYQTLLLAQETREILHKITCPVLAMHSIRDETIPADRVVRILRERVSSPLEIACFNESEHVMTLDKQGQEIASRVVQFFVKYLN